MSNVLIFEVSNPCYMKTFALSFIRELKEYTQKVDNLYYLTNYHWIMLDEISGFKTTYFFKPNGELIISLNGKVEKANWEFLDQTSILIDIRKQYYLLRHGFCDENILALKIDGTEEYAIFINETKYDSELNNLNAVINFLDKNFLHKFLNPTLYVPQDVDAVEKKHIRDGYTLKMGWFKEYLITLANSKTLSLYQKISNGKYFVYDKRHILLFDNKQVCLNYLQKQYL